MMGVDTAWFGGLEARIYSENRLKKIDVEKNRRAAETRMQALENSSANFGGARIFWR